MRIISKEHDYYDTAMAEGQDRSLVFVRHEQEWLLQENAGYPEHLKAFVDLFTRTNPRSFTISSPNARLFELVVNFGLIWFAGRLYPFACVDRRASGFTPMLVKQFCYDLDSLKAALASEGCELPVRKTRRRIDWLGRPSYEAFFALDGSASLESLAYEHKVAVASVYWGSLRLDGRLKDYEFARRMPPYQAFQELSMFLGNIAAPDRVPVNVSDKDRIVQHGFDEWSFRKMPQAVH